MSTTGPSSSKEAQRPTLAKAIGVRLRSLREERSRGANRIISQTEVGEATELDGPRINVYEKGKKLPGADVLVRLAAFYGVTLDYLVSGAGAPPAPAAPERFKPKKPRKDPKYDPLFEKIRALPPRGLRLVRAAIEYVARYSGEERPAKRAGAGRRARKQPPPAAE